jgi:group I intron endonuclease
MLGYKHTNEARKKMIEFFKDKNNHPMFGKKHTKEAIALISKPGELNPMFGKKHTKETKALISKRISKYSSGVGIYDLNDNLISKFSNNTELAKYLNISRVTVGKYLNKGLVYKDMYRFKVIQD